jgi:hypothetical protein
MVQTLGGRMMGFQDFMEKPPVTGSVAGGIAGAVATVVVAVIVPMMSGCNFERDLAMKTVKGAKSAEDLKQRMDFLCSRNFIAQDTKGKRCP